MERIVFHRDHLSILNTLCYYSVFRALFFCQRFIYDCRCLAFPLQRIGELYAIEAELRGCSAE
ncbi:hypothetical protein FIB66_25510 [Escherichia coli]|nr:hypothetical protein [Escherichia coli]EFD5109636.1 hypothetical protein [Escherichia coli]TNM79927.1 hypothetical protein FHR03_23250 [Escherichia coli]TNP70572.1 hypothetical protein FIB37_26205 [Escherichia coli]TNP87822.1 hypothetical protein FIB45_23890 [Escherichia coli]